MNRKRRKLITSLILSICRDKLVGKNKNKLWVRSWLELRKEQGVEKNLLKELRLEDEEAFRFVYINK